MKRNEVSEYRFQGLDMLKAICAFLVVCIHAPFPGEFGQYFTSLTRVAVPIFFMISGFFYPAVRKNKAEIKQMGKIIKLCLSANAIYLIWGILCILVQGKSLVEYFRQVLSAKALIKLFVFNESPFSGHLWYLGALFYVLLIVYFCERAIGNESLFIKIQCLVSPMLLAADLILGKYSLLLIGREFPLLMVRNFLFVGLPYFSLGMIINQSFASFSMNRKLTLLLILLFSVTTLLERFILVTLKVNTLRDHYISTTLLSAVIFIVCLDYLPDNKIENFLARIGREYSASIYVFHPIIIAVLDTLMDGKKVELAYACIKPIAVYVCVVACLVCLHYLTDGAKHRSRR